MIVTIREARTNFFYLIQQVAAGEEIVITRGSKPVAKLVAIGELKGKRQPGSLKGKLVVGREFFEALPPEELFAWAWGTC